MSVQSATPLTDSLEALVEEYRRWLAVERSLASVTVNYRAGVARRFLSECGDRDLKSLSVGEVIGFVVDQSSGLAVKTTKGLATALRSVLGYLYLTGVTDNELALGVPAPSGPHSTSLPRWIPAAELKALLACGDSATALGRRDHAIVVLLARLGLRVGEVVGLRLDDLDWSAGEIVVRGKGSRTERLPMPVDVGKALVVYLRRGRPVTTCRSVFVRANGPPIGLSAQSVRKVVRRACTRADITVVSPHRLRHSAATAMLRAGASLEEVGQVLRDRDAQVVALYAKVDFVALRPLALSWPGESA
jgi:site-specific recombinase XerD